MGAALHTQNMNELVALYTDGLDMKLIRTIDLCSAVERIPSFGHQQRDPIFMLYQARSPQDDDLLPALTRARYVIKTSGIEALAARLEKDG